MKKIFYFLLLTIFFSINIFASFKIDSIDFDEQIDKNGYAEYRIYNDSLTKAIYKAKIEPVGNIDITPALTFYPKVISIEPNSYTVFKIFGSDGNVLDLPNGEYNFSVSFNPIIVPTISREKGKEAITGSSSVGLIPNIVMSGYIGDIDYSKELLIENEKLYLDENGKLKITFTVVNNSHAGLVLGAQFLNSLQNKTDSTRLGRVNAKSKKEFTVTSNNFTDPKEIVYIELYNVQKGKFMEKKIK